MDSLTKKDAKTQMSSSTSYSKARAELKSHRKSKRSRSTSTSSSSSSEDSSDHKHKRHKRNSKSSKHRKSKAKKKRKSRKHKRPRSKDEVKEVPVLPESNPKSEEEFIGPSLDTMFTSNMKPMTKEEWDKKQSVVKKVYDPETDRLRLIRGDGEVLEEIVSYKRHQEINKRATAADGTRFQTTLGVDNK